MYDGRINTIGSIFPKGDGCNSCTCGMGGSVTCTDVECQTMGPEFRCQHGNRLLKANETFILKTIFFCNNCTCFETGEVSCVPAPCTDDPTCTHNKQPYRLGDARLLNDGCTVCTCTNTGDWFCSDADCPTRSPTQRPTQDPNGGRYTAECKLLTTSVFVIIFHLFTM